MRLVEEWRSAWRWFSLQAMALTAAIQAAWAAMPDDLKQHIPAGPITCGILSAAASRPMVGSTAVPNKEACCCGRRSTGGPSPSLWLARFLRFRFPENME